jgi:large subunit ribosomal protein L22
MSPAPKKPSTDVSSDSGADAMESSKTSAAASKKTSSAEPKAAAAKKPTAAKPAAAAKDSATKKPSAAAKKPSAAAKPSADSGADATESSKAPAAAKTPAASAKAAQRAASVPKRQRLAEKSAPGERQVVRAQAKYVRSSARKARLVCDNIRGKSVIEARAILAHTPRSVAQDWSKLLESAVANAEHNHELDGEDLVIKAIKADEGPTIKRFRPRAQGRATKIRKRTSHLTILLTPKD